MGDLIGGSKEVRQNTVIGDFIGLDVTGAEALGQRAGRRRSEQLLFQPNREGLRQAGKT